MSITVLPDHTQVWSCGGGTQSAAIAALIVSGKLQRPNYAFITDTGRERQSTWDYFWTVLKPKCLSIGLDIEIIHKDEWATKDLWGGEDGLTLLLPTFTTINGNIGRKPTFCSAEWKRDVAGRYMRRRLGLKKVQNWIGFSSDELRRIKSPRRQWWQFRFPLIFDIPLNRSQCVDLVKNAGWPTPPRSSCWMCPHHSDEEWIDIRNNYPGDFAAAIAIEREFRLRDPHSFLHASGVPLDQVQFDGNELESTPCDGGQCYV